MRYRMSGMVTTDLDELKMDLAILRAELYMHDTLTTRYNRRWRAMARAKIVFKINRKIYEIKKITDSGVEQESE